MLLHHTLATAAGGKDRIGSVEIPFPDGTRHSFSIHRSSISNQNGETVAEASVIKDAGDDPDITNGAEIIAGVKGLPLKDERIMIRGGSGVGVVTKPGLAVPVGRPAINPAPRKMIIDAVTEALEKYDLPVDMTFEITISVTNGEELAKKTLNSRLGIIGGISILGTTGIVRPLSAEAWTASITAAMDVAKAMGYKETVLSSGRVSEKAHMKKYGLPVETYVMMGDYVEFSLVDAKKHGFKKIHISAHWAKMLKIAMRIPQTHVRHGAIDLKQAVVFLHELMPDLNLPDSDFNTAREIFDFINAGRSLQSRELFSRVCRAAKEYAADVASGTPVTAYLVSYNGDIISDSE